MAIFGITAKAALYCLVPLTGYAIGSFLDRKESERLTLFRDKSALYGGQLKEGDPPSWP